MSGRYDAIVIGAGHNGLVTAAYLARAGMGVLVLEQRDNVGGAAVTQEFHPGFKVDSGAHCLSGLHPNVVEDLRLRDNGLRFSSPEPAVLAPLLDGRHLTLSRDSVRTTAAIRDFSARDANRWTEFTSLVGSITSFLRTVYRTTPTGFPEISPRDLWGLLRLVRGLRGLGKRQMMEALRILPMPVAEFLDEWFETDVLKGVLGASGVTGIFQGPMAAGTSYVLMHQHVWSPRGVIRGPQFVHGGIGHLTAALAEAARKNGAEISTGRAVARIVVENESALGVIVEGGDIIKADRVISSADPKRTFLNLVDAGHFDPVFLDKVHNIKYRGACAKVHLALGELPQFSCLGGKGPHLEGIISVSPSLEYLERAYDDAKYGAMSQKPYLDIVIPSLMDPTLAPAGRHVMSIFMQYAPYKLRNEEWNDAKRQELGNLVVNTLTEYVPNLPSCILHRQVYSPADLETVFGLTEGNINHGDLTLDQLFFMRPVAGWARYRTPIDGLYLCGAGTHPGGGVTGAPGYNAAREVLRDSRRKK
ncbi:MAG: phytoene desaturase family protein [Gemmatimonadales bacterium]